MGKTSTTVKDRYNAKAYDRIMLRVPKGQKEAIEAAAEAVGESVNEYTNKALRARMGLDEWPKDESGETKLDPPTAHKTQNMRAKLPAW
jgi:hypothetical protein